LAPVTPAFPTRPILPVAIGLNAESTFPEVRGYLLARPQLNLPTPRRRSAPTWSATRWSVHRWWRPGRDSGTN